MTARSSIIVDLRDIYVAALAGNGGGNSAPVGLQVLSVRSLESHSCLMVEPSPTFSHRVFI
jgi:hypothetical protein